MKTVSAITAAMLARVPAGEAWRLAGMGQLLDYERNGRARSAIRLKHAEYGRATAMGAGGDRGHAHPWLRSPRELARPGPLRASS